jgi:hypothetical protein
VTREDWRGAWNTARTTAFVVGVALAWPVGRLLFAALHGAVI